MAKYDDFGRPIYETAEEYNRAKGTGGYTRTYESPEGDSYVHNTVKESRRRRTATERHAMREGSKKAKSIVILVIFIVIAINVGIIFVTFNSLRGFSSGSYDDSVNDWIQFEDDEDYGEYLGDDTTPLPEGFETFTYNGETFSLPTTFEELSRMKFVIDTEYAEMDMVPSEYGEFIDLVDVDGNVYAMVTVDNYTEDEIPLGKCTVDYFSISNPYLYDETQTAPDFIFGNGLTFESTYEDVEAYFGTPYYHYEDHSEEGYYYDSYEWQYCGEYESHSVNIIFWNGEISDISIQKNVNDEGY